MSGPDGSTISATGRAGNAAVRRNECRLLRGALLLLIFYSAGSSSASCLWHGSHSPVKVTSAA